MAMRDPKLRKQLETHHRNANLLVRKQREKDETAARMARALRDEEDQPKSTVIKTYADLFNNAVMKSLITGSATMKLIHGKSANALIIDDFDAFSSPQHDDRVDAVKFNFGFGPTSDVLKINCT